MNHDDCMNANLFVNKNVIVFVNLVVECNQLPKRNHFQDHYIKNAALIIHPARQDQFLVAGPRNKLGAAIHHGYFQTQPYFNTL